MPFPKGGQPKQGAAEDSSAQHLCGICGKEVLKGEDEYIEARCSKCDVTPYHPDCVAQLQTRVETYNSKSREKLIVRAKHHPEQIILRMRCPAGILRGEEGECNGKIVQADMVKPVKAAPAPLPVLPRHPRQPKAAAEPPAAAAGSGKGGGKGAGKPPAGPAAAKKGASAGGGIRMLHSTGSVGSIPSSSGTGAGVNGSDSGGGGGAWSTACKSRAHTSDASSSAIHRSVSAPGGGLGERIGKQQPQGTLRFAPGTRPKRLQMCETWRECGECFMYKCEYCHGEEELAEREQEWLEEQERKKQGERLRQLDELRRREAEEAEARRLGPGGAGLGCGAWGRGGPTAAALLGGNGSGGSTGGGMPSAAASTAGVSAASAAPAMAAVRPALAAAPVASSMQWDVAAAYLQLSDAALGLMKDYKRRHCVSALQELGFDAGTSSAAADVTGCDGRLAAHLLLEGGSLAGRRLVPVEVTGEAQALLAAAKALGYSGVEDVELELVMAHGDWQAARQALEARAAAQASVAAARRSVSAASIQRRSVSATSMHPSDWSEPATPIPLSPTPSQAAHLATLLPPGTTASSSPRSASNAGALSMAAAEAGPGEPVWPAEAERPVAHSHAPAAAAGAAAAGPSAGAADPWQALVARAKQTQQAQRPQQAQQEPPPEEPEWADYGSGGAGAGPGDLASLSVALEDFRSRFGGLSIAQQGGKATGTAAAAGGLAASQPPPATTNLAAAAGGLGLAATAGSTGLAAATGVGGFGADALGFGSSLGSGIIGGGAAVAAAVIAGPSGARQELGASGGFLASSVPATTAHAAASAPFPAAATPQAAPLGASQHALSGSMFTTQLQQQQLVGGVEQAGESLLGAYGGSSHSTAPSYATANLPPAAPAAAAPDTGFDEGFRAGLAAAAQLQQLSRPDSGMGAFGAAAAGYGGPAAATATAPSYAQPGAAVQQEQHGWGAMFGGGTAGVQPAQPAALSAATQPAHDAYSWGQALQPQPAGEVRSAEEEAELQDMLSLLCT